ncbi:MAG: MjaI family restriction endonuclease [Anaerolineae bacterium]|nr:MjaI family restriction endonuclease [Anaerolineae bacterium]MCX8068040.1 MjaI family restriction endonuclease [Anaerolineae bacterium]MDW7992824.1 MjaI family restriction endonuclease [Anaerolineae bacterium]
MAKEWVLNIAFNRWQLNRPKYVGRVVEAIRACAPKSLEEWEHYYFSEVPRKHVPAKWQMLGNTMQEHLEELGRRLYAKISEQLRAEVDAITEEECVAYVRDVVIRRTYEGYLTEKRTIYEQLEQALGVKLQPAPDEWDRRYNVDFFISVGTRLVGLQIKPVTYGQIPELHRWQEWMRNSHRRFEEEKGGKVFIVFSLTEKGGRKRILNVEVIDQIRGELWRLTSDDQTSPHP